MLMMIMMMCCAFIAGMCCKNMVMAKLGAMKAAVLAKMGL